MTVGPIQMIACRFEGFDPKGEILNELSALRESGIIRLIDAQFVRKEDSGNITSMEMSGLSPTEQIEFGSVIGGMIGAGVAGAEGELEGSLRGALVAAEHSYGMTVEDIQEIANQLDPGDAAALFLIEHSWATGFRDAVGDAGGHMVAQGFLTPDTLFMVGAELEAQVQAMAAIEISEVIQEEAAYEALEAIAVSRAIQEEAALRAAEALFTAELIEEAAIVDAARVVAEAVAIEEAAIEEAAQVVDLAIELEDAAEKSMEESQE
jgi:uncharacterized membrane protein